MRLAPIRTGLAVLLTYLAPVAASAASLIVDGGFESGITQFNTAFDNQTGSGAPSGAGTYALVGSFNGLSAYSGSLYMAINGFDAQLGQLIWQQSFNVVSGQSYALSGAVGTWSNGSPLGNFDVVANGQLLTNVTAPSADNTWETFGASWTANTTGTINLDFVERANSFAATDYALDELSFAAAVPLPATLPLLALLLGGLGCAGLRKRARGRA